MRAPTASARPSLATLCWAAGLALVSSLLFSLTSTDAVQVADSAELVAVACNGGVAHPPGYPLATLLGGALCAIPGLPPAGRVALLSLIAGVATVLLLFAAALRLTGSRPAAAAGALTLATASLFWRFASQPDIRTLHTALALALVLAALRCADEPRPRRRLLWATLTGASFGLALCNHHTSVALLPLVATALLFPWGSLGRAASRAAAALFGLLVGLLPYATLLAADPQRLPHWGDVSTPAGLLHHFLRQDYGTLTLAIGARAGRLDNLVHYVARTPGQLAWVGFPLALLGLGLLLWARGDGAPGASSSRAAPRLPRAQALGLAATALCAGPGVMLLLNVPPRGIGAQVVERFHALPNALLCLCAAIGLAALAQRWRAAGHRALATALGVAMACAIVGAAGHAYPRADLSQSYTVESYAEHCLAAAEPGALIVGTGDVELFAMAYARHVRGLRPDAQYVDARMLLYPWYVAQLKRLRPGLRYRFQPRHADSIALIAGELRRGRPVYIAHVYNPQVAAAFDLTPSGPLLRVRRRGALPQTLSAVVAHNEAVFARFRRRGRPPDPRVDPWSAALLQRYAATWRTLAAAAEHVGEPQLAGRLRARAAAWSAP